jgi:small subunit ribosomal protein S2
MTVNTTKAKKSSIKIPTVRELLEAGAHFGHETKRWNPNYAEFIYTKRDKFHIIDLEKTLKKFKEALEFIQKVAPKGNILIVGTKRQARDIVREEAIRCGAHFVINRWVGGTISNFPRISKSIEKLRKIEEKLKGDVKKYTQQQLAVLRREWARYDRLFGGIKKLEKLPDVVIIIDAKYEKMTVRELKSAKIPIIAVVDSNTNPKGIDYPIPANDDAIKSVELLVKYISDAILKGNRGRGVRHEFEDLSMVGIKKSDIKKVKSEESRIKNEETSSVKSKDTVKTVEKKVVKKKVKGSRQKVKGKKLGKKKTVKRKKVIKSKTTSAKGRSVSAQAGVSGGKQKSSKAKKARK